MGEVFGNRYELTTGIGSGGHGAVYLALDRQASVQTYVAIKTLRHELIKDQTSLRRFRREAEVLRVLSHRNIVRCYEYSEAPIPWMALEYADGPTLSHILALTGALNPLPAAQLVTQLLAGLAEAHKLSIAHRDLKPSNIVIIDWPLDPLLKLLDFGVAVRPPRNASSVRITGTGEVVGTPLYLAPERITSDESGDARSDVWSVGVLLYELVTGQRPFAGETLWEQLGRMLSGEYAPIASHGVVAHESFSQIIATALQPEPWKRFENAQHMLDTIQSWIDSVAKSGKS